MRELNEPEVADSVIYRTVDVTVRMQVRSSREFAEHNAWELCQGVVRAEGWTVTDAELIEP